MTFFTELGKPVLKFRWKHKRHEMTVMIVSKQNKDGNTAIPDGWHIIEP